MDRIPAKAQLGGTSSVVATRVVLACARQAGVDPDRLVADVGLDPTVLDDPDGRVPLRLQRRLWETAAARSHDPLFGLHVADASPIGAYEALDYALWASSTLEDVLDRLARFYRLVGDDLELHMVPRGRWIHVHRAVVHDQRHRAECFFAVLVGRVRALLAEPFRLREVRFAHRGPADVRPYRARFRCPVRFGCRLTELVFEADQLHAPVQSARPGLAAVLDRYMRDLVKRLPRGDSLLHRVHDAIARSLHGGRPSVAATARRLHASPRTVQRYLQQLGVTHRQLVEDVRRDLADRLLSAGRLSIGEIAYLLGFEDAGAFRRAYKRWTGISPTRRRLQS